MPTPIDSITEPGTYEIETLTGSTYRFELFDEPDAEGVRGTLLRMPAQVPAADGREQSAAMRRDTEALRVYAFEAEVGRKGCFLLEPLGESGSTTRLTSVIQSISRIDSPNRALAVASARLKLRIVEV